MALERCPNCGHKGTKGLTHSYFYVYTCGDCKTRYCFKCPNSNGGQKCPKCGGKAKTYKEEVYEK